MSNFAFCVLGSGSRGNCSLLKTSETKWIMIDSGFSMRQTKERMRTHNICMDDVSDLLLTHLDRDHFNPVWCRSLLNRGIYVHLHESHVERGIRAGLDHSILKPFTTSIDFESLHVETLHLAHDALGTVGFVFNHLECKTRFGFATDLGRVPKTLLDAFKSLDILAFESNYDPMMQRTSGRPDFLQDRIMGGGGHLSNEESLNAVKHIAENSNLQHIVLLHLSKQCNSPAIIRDLYHDNLAHLYNCVTITDQDRCSRLLRFEKQPTSLF